MLPTFCSESRASFRWGRVALSGSLMVLVTGCASPEPQPPVEVHYLGHAAFVLSFPQGSTVLTDYGQSNAWGLDSPIFGLGGLVPDVATRSHQHLDHAGGALPEGVEVLLEGGEPYQDQGLVITPIPTFEELAEAPDNFSFLLEFQKLKILHLGDCQGLMVALAEEKRGGEPTDVGRVEALIRRIYPNHYDLVFLPIGFTRDILEEAAAFLTLLDAEVVVPMHYWDPGDQDRFLELMVERTTPGGRRYAVRTEGVPTLRVPSPGKNGGSVQLVGLTPAPYPDQTIPGKPGSVREREWRRLAKATLQAGVFVGKQGD